MPRWVPASSVFSGGTSQIQAIKGRRVRARVPLSSLNVYDPDPGSARLETFSVHAGAIGLVTNPNPGRPELLIAFSLNEALVPTTLDKLMRDWKFKVIIVNEPTFKLQFEIES